MGSKFYIRRERPGPSPSRTGNLATKRKTAKKKDMKKKRGPKRRDTIAMGLKDPRFARRVVKSAKLYSRKSKQMAEPEIEP